MTRRHCRAGVATLVRELRAQGDRIVEAIRETSAEQNARREAIAVNPPIANPARTPAPTTPPAGPANDHG